MYCPWRSLRAYFLFFSPHEPSVPPKGKAAKGCDPEGNSCVPVSQPDDDNAGHPGSKDRPPPQQLGRDIVVKTKQFEAVFSEEGGTLKSHKLAAYKETLGVKDLKEMIQVDQSASFPLQLEWIKKSQPEMAQARFAADKDSLIFKPRTTQGNSVFSLDLQARA